jgi:hypothetical protein
MKKFYYYFEFSIGNDSYWFFICDGLFFLFDEKENLFHLVNIKNYKNKFLFSVVKTFHYMYYDSFRYADYIYPIKLITECKPSINIILPNMTTENENKLYSIIDKYF